MPSRRLEPFRPNMVRSAFRKAAFAALLVAATLISPAANAGNSPYLILRSQSHHYVNPGPAYSVSRPSYSYGYFGAGRHRAHVWHEGYYGAWRQKTVWNGW